MIRDHLQRNILLLVLAVGHPRYLGSVLDDREKQIRLEIGLLVLQHGCQTLQTAACVDVLVHQRIVLPVLCPVILGEHQIPDFQIAVAVASHAAGRKAAAALFSQIDVDLRIRPAGSRPDFPEVVLHAHDMILGESRLLQPDLLCLVILRIDGDPELLLWQFHDLRQEFPSPRNRFRLEIISKGEIAQHLEVGLMARRASHILDIPRAHAALARRDSRAGRFHLPRKKRLERRHARADHQKRRIVLRNQRCARQPQMPLLLRKELQISLPQLISTHIFQTHQPPTSGIDLNIQYFPFRCKQLMAAT